VVPQAPQFAVSCWVLTHWPLQRVVPVAHGCGFGSTTQRLATQTKPVGHGGSSGVPQKKMVVREQPDNERPASAPARTTKRMEDVMDVGSGWGKSALSGAASVG
jgi:hypothetical protein